MGSKHETGIANSVDPDQTAPRGAVWSNHSHFAYSHFAYSRFAYDLSHFAYSHFAYSRFTYSKLFH